MEIFLIVCMISFLASCGGQGQDVGVAPRSVSVVQALPADGEAVRSYTFVSKPYRTTSLSFRVGGPVTSFDVQSGRYFRKGELIAAIDDRDFVIRRDRAEAVYRQAESEYRRISSLYDSDNISGSVYEKAKSDYVQARAAYDTAVNDLNDTRLLAPFDGYVQDVNIERFQDVRASVPVVSFIDLSKVKVEAYVPEDMAAYLRTCDKSVCKVTFQTMDGRQFIPSEIYVSQTTSNNNISFLLTALVDNSDNSLVGGMSGEISLPVRLTSASSSVVIPQTAVANRGVTGSYVWKITDGNHVERTPVVVGSLCVDNSVEIISGLLPGDTVVSGGLHFLGDNEQVTIMKQKDVIWTE